MEYLIFIIAAAVMSIIATLLLQYSCYRLDQVLLRREIESLRAEFDFQNKRLEKKVTNSRSLYCDNGTMTPGRSIY